MTPMKKLQVLTLNGQGVYSRIWRLSGIQDMVRRYDGDICLLGDSGYGITPWLLTPSDKQRNANARNFNLTHGQERVIIERLFG